MYIIIFDILRILLNTRQTKNNYIEDRDKIYCDIYFICNLFEIDEKNQGHIHLTLKYIE